MKAVVGEKHPYFIARQWDELQNLCMQQGEKISKEQFFGVCYEELIDEPEKVIRELCEFLGIEYYDNMLIFHKSNEASRAANSSKLWENVSQPIMKKNSNKFMKEMSDLEVSIVESIAGNTMDKLGYERLKIDRGYELRFTDTDIELFKSENHRLKHTVVKNTDPEDINRRRKQDSVIQNIVAFSEGIDDRNKVA